MKKIILLSAFSFITLSSVLAKEGTVLERLMKSAKEEYESKKSTYKLQVANEKRNIEGLADFEKQLTDLKAEKEKTKLSLENYDQSIEAFKIFAKNGLDNLSFIQKIESRKKKFYNCVLDGIEKSNYPNTDRCQDLYPAKFSTKEKMMIGNYKMFLSSPKETLNKNIESIEKNEVVLEDTISRWTNSLEKSSNFKEISFEALKSKEQELEDIARLAGQEEFYKCKPGMKEIDLENEYIYEGAKRKGPFYGVKKDNQDGIGSCFANTAKNLLVSLSDGKYVGSFLDMALQYKKSSGNYITTGIDGGGSCPTLHEIKKVGFCDQKYSPAETGEKNEFLTGLLSPKGVSVTSQGIMIDKLSRFLVAKKSLEAIDSKFSDYFLKNPKLIVEKLKADPEIVFPLPIVERTAARNWQTKQAFYVANKNPSETLKDEFEKSIEELDKNFKSKYIQLILNDEGVDSIIAAYSKPFKEVLSKYGMSDSYEQIIKFHKANLELDYNEDNKRKLFKSVRFLQNITNSDSIPTQSFAAKCIEAFDKGFDFLEKLNPLVRQVAAINGQSDLLLEGDNFKEGAELMQLAIAPACLNEANRTKIDFSFSCVSGMRSMTALKSKFLGDDLNEAFRIKVVKNLLDGLAVGSAFPMTGGRHINTIVGVRFNSERNRCEFKVRESQNGRSEWHDEGPIVRKTDDLTEVSRL